jgi:DNA invertase Pin-like site-specific DNA recombinase
MPRYKGQTIAYLRVSSDSQNLDRQAELKQAAHKVFEEKASAGTRQRPILAEMLAYARSGDTVRVWSMDRLARSLMDLQTIVKELTDKGVTVEFVMNNLTFQPAAKNDPYAQFQFQVLGAVAELERNIIRERQAEGIAKAKERGVYKGRKPSLTAEQLEDIRYRSGLGVAVAKLAKDHKVSRQTIYKALVSVRESSPV